MSNHIPGGTTTSKSAAHNSADLKGLLEHQSQIKQWLKDVNSKIYTLEEAYLEETPLGNIIRGWEIDGKPLPLKMKGQEEKERLFTFSSYQMWFDKKGSVDSAQEGVGEKRSHHAANGSNNKSLDGPKSKKSRKISNSKKGADQYEEWEQHGDY